MPLKEMDTLSILEALNYQEPDDDLALFCRAVLAEYKELINLVDALNHGYPRIKVDVYIPFSAQAFKNTAILAKNYYQLMETYLRKNLAESDFADFSKQLNFFNTNTLEQQAENYLFLNQKHEYNPNVIHETMTFIGKDIIRLRNHLTAYNLSAQLNKKFSKLMIMREIMLKYLTFVCIVQTKVHNYHYDDLILKNIKDPSINH